MGEVRAVTRFGIFGPGCARGGEPLGGAGGRQTENWDRIIIPGFEGTY